MAGRKEFLYFKLFIMENVDQIRLLMDEWESRHLSLKGEPPNNLDYLCKSINENLVKYGFWRYRLLSNPSIHELSSLISLCLSISRGIGYVLPQTIDDKVVTLIQDEGANYSSPTTRGHMTNSHLAFHCDRADVTVLLYVRPADSGGEFSIVGFSDAMEEMKREHSELYSVLFDDFPFDLREDRLFLSPKWYKRPICWQSGGRVYGHYIRRFISDSKRHSDCPVLSTVQEEALDVFDRVLEKIGKVRQFPPLAGEFVVTDNFRVMHARTAFEDSDKNSSRLALRVWVAPYESIELPRFMQPLMGSVAAGSYRGGVGASQIHIESIGLINSIK